MSSFSEPASRDPACRPVLVVANSSWYLLHYRNLLLQSLQCDGKHVLALSPVDSSTPELSKLLIHIPWRIHRSTDSNPFSLGISFLRMLFLVRAIKPCFVHSHTLKANMLAVVVTAILGIPCVLSFAGMGRLSKSKGLSRFAFLLVLRTIAFFAVRQRSSRFCWRLSPRRTSLIFQNPIDQQIFQKALPKLKVTQNYLIPGSGVPARYLQPGLSQKPVNNWWLPPAQQPRCELLFCGRLLRSKGIFTFLELAAQLDDHRFKVFGAVDLSSNDSLLNGELSSLQQQHPNLVFVGSQPDPLLNLDADYPVLIVPSNYGEGLPRAVLEAFSLGIPVISSKSATCGIFSEANVYISSGDDPGDYVSCFDQLLADHASGRLQSRLQDCRNLVEQQLSESAVVQQTMNVFLSLQREQAESYLLTKDNARLQHWLAQ